MKVKKILITAGNSISTDNKNLHTWNHYLEDGYDEVYHLGADALGNRLIVRRVTEKLLSMNEPDADIDVVILSCGLSYHHYISNSKQYLNSQQIVDVAMRQLESLKTNEPTLYEIAKERGEIDTMTDANADQHIDIHGNVIDKDLYAYMYFAPMLDDETVKEYYEKFVNTINNWEETTFAILNLQELCKSRNANFFWGNSLDTYYSVYEERIKYNNPHVAWAYDNLDMERCFCMQGMTKWTRDNFSKSRGFADYTHPSQSAHKQFTKSVIQPFIINAK
jgi:hypothetical protein